jgi:hypothetical protein
MSGITRRTSISLSEELLEKGQLMAKRRRRNFSNYVADLIASDLEASAGKALIQPSIKKKSEDRTN